MEPDQLRNIGWTLRQIQVQVQNARVRRVQQAKPVGLWPNLHIGIDCSVNNRKLSEKHRSPDSLRQRNGVVQRRGIEKLAVFVQRTVLQYERNFVFTGRQVHAQLFVVPQQVEA